MTDRVDIQILALKRTDLHVVKGAERAITRVVKAAGGVVTRKGDTTAYLGRRVSFHLPSDRTVRAAVRLGVMKVSKDRGFKMHSSTNGSFPIAYKFLPSKEAPFRVATQFRWRQPKAVGAHA